MSLRVELGVKVELLTWLLIYVTMIPFIANATRVKVILIGIDRLVILDLACDETIAFSSILVGRPGKDRVTHATLSNDLGVALHLGHLVFHLVVVFHLLHE